MRPGSRMRCTRCGLIVERAPAGSLEILELAAPQRPEKGREPETAETKGHRNEPCERDHGFTSFHKLLRPSRNAFAVTASDEVDMAIAAMSGVAYPAMASGTNTML